jgi:hypothetical protein
VTVEDLSARRRRETDDRPTEPIDYGALNAAFAVLLGALAMASRGHPERVRAALEPRELPLVVGATFAVSKAVARERIGVWVRDPFVENAHGGRRQPRGRRLRHAMGELLTCTRCVGAWSALGVVAMRIAAPEAGRLATGVLATSAANDLTQAAFRFLCEAANAGERVSTEGRGVRAGT